MNPEIKAKWVAALRSGQYPQGRHALRAKDIGYCCLGVLCEVRGLRSTCDGPQETYTYTLSSGVPSRTGLDLYELDLCGLVPDNQRELMARNDAGQSFQRIADYIEEKL